MLVRFWVVFWVYVAWAWWFGLEHVSGLDPSFIYKFQFGKKKRRLSFFFFYQKRKKINKQQQKTNIEHDWTIEMDLLYSITLLVTPIPSSPKHETTMVLSVGMQLM